MFYCRRETNGTSIINKGYTDDKLNEIITINFPNSLRTENKTAENYIKITQLPSSRLRITLRKDEKISGGLHKTTIPISNHN